MDGDALVVNTAQNERPGTMLITTRECEEMVAVRRGLTLVQLATTAITG